MADVDVNEEGDHSREGHLVRMANEIGDFFGPQGDANVAIEGIANHMKNFWTRSMLAKLTAHVGGGAPELNELPREALHRINEGRVNAVPTAGGDAG
jgi:formate dehydrogenase subunit delta